MMRIPPGYQPTTGELYELILTLKDATDLGFGCVDGRLDKLEWHIDRVEGRLTGIDGRLSGIERWAARVDERLATIESQNIAVRLNDHEQRMGELERFRKGTS